MPPWRYTDTITSAWFGIASSSLNRWISTCRHAARSSSARFLAVVPSWQDAFAEHVEFTASLLGFCIRARPCKQCVNQYQTRLLVQRLSTLMIRGLKMQETICLTRESHSPLSQPKSTCSYLASATWLPNSGSGSSAVERQIAISIHLQVASSSLARNSYIWAYFLLTFCLSKSGEVKFASSIEAWVCHICYIDQVQWTNQLLGTIADDVQGMDFLSLLFQ